MVKTVPKKVDKKDRNKVKLKGQRLLPKGLNVTDTSFKVKKIVIKEQLKDETAKDILSRKKFDIKELVSKLDHQNLKVRKEALADLTQVVEICPKETLERQLPTILEAVAKMTIDLIYEIRSDALNLISVTLNRVSAEQIRPRFHILTAYVLCAMTNIVVPIREDSLKLLDMLLATSPQSVASKADDILPKVLDLISIKSANGRTLSLHLDGKIAVHKWRAHVLDRLWKLLVCIHESAKQSGSDKDAQNTVQCKNVIWDENKQLHIPLYSDIYFQPSLINVSGEEQKILNKKNSASVKMQEYTEKLIPLLLDMFTEVTPKIGDSNGYHEITILAAVHLKRIVDIILLLLEIFKTSEDHVKLWTWFSGTFAIKLYSSLIHERFPYQMLRRKFDENGVEEPEIGCFSLAENSEKVNYDDDDDDDNDDDDHDPCLLQNLGLVRLILRFKTYPQYMSKQSAAISYLRNCLRSCGTLSVGQCTVLHACIKEICYSKTYQDEALSILGSIAKLTEYWKELNRPFSCMLFDILTGITLNPKLSKLHSVDAFQHWLSNLPEVLTFPSIRYKTIKTISLISRRGIPAFSSGLDGWIENILDNAISIKILGTEESDNNEAEIMSGRRDIISLLYWVKDWDAEVVSNLGKAVVTGFYGPELTTHLLDVLQLKVINEPEGPLRSLLLNEEWWKNCQRSCECI